MATFSAKASSYDQCCGLIAQLKAAGIDACLTVGGISIICCDQDEVDQAKKICTERGAYFKAGYTHNQESNLISSEPGYDLAKECRQDAINLTSSVSQQTSLTSR